MSKIKRKTKNRHHLTILNMNNLFKNNPCVRCGIRSCFVCAEWTQVLSQLADISFKYFWKISFVFFIHIIHSLEKKNIYIYFFLKWRKSLPLPAQIHPPSPPPHLCVFTCVLHGGDIWPSLSVQAAGAVHCLCIVPLTAGDHQRPAFPKCILLISLCPDIQLSVLFTSSLLPIRWDLNHSILLCPVARCHLLPDIASCAWIGVNC